MSVDKFYKKKIYNGLLSNTQTVSWRKLMYDNEARPRAIFIIWIACHGRLATNDRLMRFGILDNDNCVFCVQVLKVCTICCLNAEKFEPFGKTFCSWWRWIIHHKAEIKKWSGWYTKVKTRVGVPSCWRQLLLKRFIVVGCIETRKYIDWVLVIQIDIGKFIVIL